MGRLLLTETKENEKSFKTCGLSQHKKETGLDHPYLSQVTILLYSVIPNFSHVYSMMRAMTARSDRKLHHVRSGTPCLV